MRAYDKMMARCVLGLALAVGFLRCNLWQLVINLAGLATGQVRIVNIAGRWTLTRRKHRAPGGR